LKVTQPIIADRSSPLARGFSLIELLITVLVIVLLTSVVSLNVGRGGGEIALKEDAQHLLALMEYVQTEAEIQG